MPQKSTFTVDEIRSILSVHYALQKKSRDRLSATMQAAGLLAGRETSYQASFREKAEALILDLMARRMARDNRNVPLLSYDDVDYLVDEMVKGAPPEEGLPSDSAGQALYKKFLKATLERLIEFVTRDSDLYEMRWSHVRAISELAHKKGVRPANLLTIDGAYDELMRHLYTEGDYRSSIEKQIQRFTDLEAVKREVIYPILEAVAGDDNERLRDLIEAVDDTAIEEFRQTKLIPIAQTTREHIDKECRRIWGAEAKRS